jgi:hypothetical protein
VAKHKAVGAFKMSDVTPATHVIQLLSIGMKSRSIKGSLCSRTNSTTRKLAAMLPTSLDITVAIPFSIHLQQTCEWLLAYVP